MDHVLLRFWNKRANTAIDSNPRGRMHEAVLAYPGNRIDTIIRIIIMRIVVRLKLYAREGKVAGIIIQVPIFRFWVPL